MDFYKLHWKKAEASLKDYVSRIPSRIAALEANVRSTAGFEDWRANRTDESFRRLGPWMLKVGRVQPVCPDDVQVEVYNPKLHPSTVEFMLELAKRDLTAELTEETAVIAVDIGIYCGEAVREQCPSLRWRRCKAKCDVNFNYPLLEMKTSAGQNPIDASCRFTMALLDGREQANEYHRMLHMWMRGAANSEDYRQQKLLKAERKRQERRLRAKQSRE